MVKEVQVSFETPKDLHTVLSAPGPCLSVYLTLRGGRQDELNWKETLQTLGQNPEQYGAPARDLLASVANWNEFEPGSEQQTKPKSVAVFRSSDVFQVSYLDVEVPNKAVLGPHFYIRPLLPALVQPGRFYLLALSQKNTRLLYCTRHTSQEVSFPADVKTNYEVWMNQVKPDHTGNSGTSGTPGTTDQDTKNEYLTHYFKQVDRGVNELLRGKADPLIICGVEYELPIYNKVNSYPHLSSEEVRGAANSLKSGEMHARALEALDRAYAAKVGDALTEWNHRVGAGASSRLKDVVTAAHDGRVLTLLISDSQELTGTFDEATHQVKGRETGGGQDEDLLNDAAVQTILHNGQVLVTPHHKLPNGSPLAAIFRY